MLLDPRVALVGGPGLSGFLAAFTEATRLTLGHRFAGAYLHGSLSTGSFNPRSSDIDVLVTTRRLTDGATNDRIHEQYEQLLGRDAERWAELLDAVFVPAAWLRAPGVPAEPVPTMRPGEGFAVVPLGPEFVIQREMTRRYGVRLAGAPPRRITTPASSGALRQSQAETLRVRWESQVDFPGQLLARPYQAYAVLTMCRALYVLTRGAVVPKPEAAAWVLRNPGLAPWHPLVKSAIAYPGGGSEDRRAETLEFVEFTLDQAGIGHDAPSS